MNNRFIEFLNLKEDDIEEIAVQSLQKELVVQLALKRKQQPCPTCGMMTSTILNTYTRTFNHGIFLNRQCKVHINKKGIDVSYATRVLIKSTH